MANIPIINVGGSDYNLTDTVARAMVDANDYFYAKNLGIANLFNPNAQNLIGKYYDRTNTLQTDAATSQTDYISVIPGEYYYTDESGGFILWYDGSKNFLSYDNRGAITDRIQAPVGAWFARFIFSTQRYNEFHVCCEQIKSIDGNMFLMSRNLVDKKASDYLVDQYYDQTGTLQSQEGYEQTGLIPVEPGDILTSNERGFTVVWYKADKTFLSSTAWSVFTQDGYVTAPSNAKYARFGAYRVNEPKAYAEWQVVHGKLLPVYMPYGSVRILQDIFGAGNYNGLACVAFGTSLTYRSQTTGGYLNLLPGMSGMTIDNQGIGNSGILYGGEIYDAITDYADYSSKQVCIIEGFVNDWANSAALGVYTDDNTTTVCGLVRKAIKHVLSQNPGITIFVVLDHYGCSSGETSTDTHNSLTQYQYYEEIAKVCESLGIHVIKLYAISGMSENTPQYYLDDIHPSAQGALQTANAIWSEMKRFCPNVY